MPPPLPLPPPVPLRPVTARPGRTPWASLMQTRIPSGNPARRARHGASGGASARRPAALTRSVDRHHVSAPLGDGRATRPPSWPPSATRPRTEPPLCLGGRDQADSPREGHREFRGKRGKWPQAAEEDTLQKASLQKPWRLSDGSSGGTALLVGEPTRTRAPWGPVRGRGGFSPHAQSLQRGDPSGGSSPKAQTQTTAPREAPSAGCCGRAPRLLADAAGAPAFLLMSWGPPSSR